MKILQAEHLHGISYQIRGELAQRAEQMKAAQLSVINLGIGNVPLYGYYPAPEIQAYVAEKIRDSALYTESKGLPRTRACVLQESKRKGIQKVSLENIMMGDGASSLIRVALQALLNPGDEILLPSPCFPLWGAFVRFGKGVEKYYRCSEDNAWNPDTDHIRSLITPQTKGLVLINPNNPTGAVYSRESLLEIIEICRQNNLILFCDEVYDRLTFDGEEHTSVGSLCDDVLVLTFGSLSKNFQACGYRSGWLIVSGNTNNASSYIQGLHFVTSLSLCANLMGQYATEAALSLDLSSYQEHVVRNFQKKRDIVHQSIANSRHLSCVKPQSALYVFPKIEISTANHQLDYEMARRLLEEYHILLIPGQALCWHQPDHVRITFLAEENDLKMAISSLDDLISSMNA